jgi:hypothetical protein
MAIHPDLQLASCIGNFIKRISKGNRLLRGFTASRALAEI